jgi:hypothetical protein
METDMREAGPAQELRPSGRQVRGVHCRAVAGVDDQVDVDPPIAEGLVPIAPAGRRQYFSPRRI